MISVDEAQDRIAALLSPVDSETIDLTHAGGRVLRADAVAARNQPPFPSSAMDGYAIRAADLAPGAVLYVIGEVAAGQTTTVNVTPGTAVRIFTGAPVPDGADHILIQEDTDRDGNRITIRDNHDTAAYIRPAGTDFAQGFTLTAPRGLGHADVALLAAMGHATITVARKPVVAIVATGDELVWPDQTPQPGQIIASNNFGLKAMLDDAGAATRLLPIARDNADSLADTLRIAAEADLVVTMGGASVGDHDLVAPVARELGLEMSFHRIAMRPGKPLMAGKLKHAAFVGLPGNPVSSMVCARLFVLPAIAALQGLGYERPLRQSAELSKPLRANGPREHYMRAIVSREATVPTISALDRQDSSLLTILSEANALLIRPIGDGPREPGEIVPFIAL